MKGRSIFAMACLVLLHPISAFAGSGSEPFEAQLDLAEHVVVGEIIEIKESDFVQPSATHYFVPTIYGVATVAIKENLKGAQAESIKFVVPIRLGALTATIIHTRRVGDSGIWLILTEGGEKIASRSHDLSDMRELDTVKKTLRELAARKWSAPVNGLKAWAKECYKASDDRCSLIFAVNNTTDKDIYVPSPMTYDFVKAQVTDSNGKISEIVLWKRDTDRSLTMYCERLAPGKTVFLHPQHSWINLRKADGLPSGKCSVVISCENLTTKGECERKPVQAWTGKLEAPPVEIVPVKMSR
ncbi:MAG TPA: hypothetical protein VKX17_28570 [Planctomycetota bacterium]|nr:hypothetical protein [Planctomycetota bacterium]